MKFTCNYFPENSVRRWCSILAFAISSLPAIVSATPFMYRFHMPAFTASTGDLTGKTSVLDVTVDNGNSSPFNQSYLNTQIVAYSVSVDDTSFSLNLNLTNSVLSSAATAVGDKTLLN
jgi:hypothetical protein